MLSEFNNEREVYIKKENKGFCLESLWVEGANNVNLRRTLYNYWTMWTFNGGGSILRNTAERLMSVPISQADSERIFSKISCMYGYQRHALKDKIV
jgi:hypothetical protein